MLTEDSVSAGHDFMYVKYRSGQDQHNIVVPPTPSGALCGDDRVAFVGTEGRPRPMLFCAAFFDLDPLVDVAPLSAAQVQEAKTHGRDDDKYTSLGEDHNTQAGLMSHLIAHQAAPDGMPCRPYRPLFMGEDESALEPYLEPHEVSLLANQRSHGQAGAPDDLWQVLPENEPDAEDGDRVAKVDM